MSQSIISSEVNKDVCEAVGCFAEAITEIKVKVGQRGVIMLRLCRDCTNKFEDG